VPLNKTLRLVLVRLVWVRLVWVRLVWIRLICVKLVWARLVRLLLVILWVGIGLHAVVGLWLIALWLHSIIWLLSVLISIRLHTYSRLAYRYTSVLRLLIFNLKAFSI